jgi:hypothetical protein
MCVAIDNTENAEKIVVEAKMLLAIDEPAARQDFIIKNAGELGKVAEGEVVILVTPFCRS